jgi:acetoacetate decarboxylase
LKSDDVRKRAYSMPLTSAAYPQGPYRYVDREFLVITYRTDPGRLREVVPEPLEIVEPLVKFEFIRIPDSTGFGDYTESGQVIPVRLGAEAGGYSHAMYLNDGPPIFGGRELWGFPRSMRNPRSRCTRTRWSAPSTTVRCGSQRAPWASSTGPSTTRRRSPPSASRTSF